MCQPNAGKKADDENIDGACYLWWALDGMAGMARVLGHEREAEAYGRQAEALSEAINQAFWSAEKKIWAAWIEGNGAQNLSLFTDGRYHPSVIAPMRLGAADMSKGHAACRTLSRQCVSEIGFQGPAATAWTSGQLARGCYRYGLPVEGKRLIDCCVRGALNDDMFVPSYSSVMGGEPTASRKIHYSWSCGPFLEAIVCGMFGITPNAFEDFLLFEPQIPDGWRTCALEGIRVGDHVVDFVYTAPVWTIRHVSGSRELTVAFRAFPTSAKRDVVSIPSGAFRVFLQEPANHPPAGLSSPGKPT